jgi:hypothetical protein
MARTDTSGWRQNDPVTSRDDSAKTGKVLVLRRQSDGRPYVRVQIVAGGPAGMWEWPDRWCLGVGAYGKSCADCARGFRTDDKGEVLCLACERAAFGERNERNDEPGVDARELPGTRSHWRNLAREKGYGD